MNARVCFLYKVSQAAAVKYYKIIMTRKLTSLDTSEYDSLP